MSTFSHPQPPIQQSIKLTQFKTVKQLGQVSAMAFTYKGIILATCLIMLLLALIVECQEQVTVESRQQKDNDDLTDTIKYLEKLDKYFSQIARPR